ncbi:MAG: ribosomal methyltransferase KsgA/Dim1 family protein [Marmoricola sp.]|nr:ribosomal methyltransferase KsgA/Dim1 family protein [Marmoricola sp.]
MTEPIPPTRWELADTGQVSQYAELFEDLIDQGVDVDGEARLADTLAPRRAQVLDAGSGMGRVAAALAARGHDVTAVEKDPDLVARSRARYPGVPVLETDILGLSTALLEEAGQPTAYDVVVVVGNVMVYLAEGTETRALWTLGQLLRPGGRVLVGFHPQQGPKGSRNYPVAEFTEHVEGAGLRIQQLFGTYDLLPPADDYVVAVLAAH